MEEAEKKEKKEEEEKKTRIFSLAHEFMKYDCDYDARLN